MKRLIRAFVVGALLGFIAGLIAPPRERRAEKRTDERRQVESVRELAPQASEK
jgi:gas vesicle protein